MGKKNQSEDKQKDLIMREAEAPSEIEAKVDAMLRLEDKAAESPKIEKKQKIEEPTAAGAPLLPAEKLPIFDKKDFPAKTEPKVDTLAVQPKGIKDEIGMEDPATDKAVDEITKAESDRMLAIDDAKAELLAKGTTLKDSGGLAKLKSMLKNWWSNPKTRVATLAFGFLLIAITLIVPASRYFALNLVGIRASTSMRIVDEKTGQPLKNAEVFLSGKSNKTDKDGKVKLEKVKLGQQKMAIKKPAFADYQRDVTIGWGSNPLNDVRLTAVGSRYSFEIKDFLSGQPVSKAEAISGEYSAQANEKGEIILVVDDESEADVEIAINSENYRNEKFTLPVGAKEVQKLQLVPAKKLTFVSKRSGKFDLYKVDVDGKNEEKILAGTGSEQEDKMVILPHATKDVVAFVSTRENQHNHDGFALSVLNIVDLTSNQTNKITFSERIQLVDFIGDKLVYVKITEGTSAASPNRHRLLSYDTEKNEEKELASTNYFNDVMSISGAIYYSPASYNVNGSVGLFKINPDGTDKKQIHNAEVWNLFRTSYHKFAASVGQDWYEYDIGTSSFNRLGGAPPTLKSRVYSNSPNGKKSAWVDDRDGKGVLVIYDIETNEERALHSQSGLRTPIRWLDDDHLVYRISSANETADYAISLSGGTPKKITDVTNTSGLDRWYYY